MTKTKTTLLYVYTYNFMHTEAGSYLRAQEILKRLCKYDIDIVVYSRSSPTRESTYSNFRPWRPEDIQRFKSAYPQVKLLVDVDSLPARTLRRVRHLATLLFPSLFSAVSRFRVPGLDPSWSAACRARPDIVFVNYSHSLAELNGLPRSVLVVDQHDIEFIKNRREWKRPPYSVRVLAKQRRELACLAAADIVLAISHSEFLANKMLLDGPTHVFYPYLTTRRAKPAANQQRKLYDVCFLGSDSLFNREGLRRFLEMYEDDECTFSVAVAGKVCGASELQQFRERLPHVHWLGYVDDALALFEKSRASICPVAGGGTKIKIIESLQHGIPVFASDESLEGLLPGYDGCVFPLTTQDICTFLEEQGDLKTDCELYMDQYEEALSNNAFIALLDATRGGADAEQVWTRPGGVRIEAENARRRARKEGALARHARSV